MVMRVWGAALTCLLWANAGMAQTSLVAVADEWPPFSGQELPGKGISLDVIAAVLERSGYDVQTLVLPWPRVIAGAQSGEYGIVGSLFYDPDVASYMTYSDPFYQTDVQFVQRSGAASNVETLQALEAYSIAVGDGFFYEEEFDRSEALNKVVVSTTLQGLQMVAADRVNLTLDSVEVIQHSLSVAGALVAENVEILPHVLASHDVHMAVRNSLPNRDQVIADFNRTLAEMRADGSLDALLAKHVQP